MRIRLTQIDGKLPNLALMSLAHYHRARGDVRFTKCVERQRGEPIYSYLPWHKPQDLGKLEPRDPPEGGENAATRWKRATGQRSSRE
jgi:hypothetical protein